MGGLRVALEQIKALTEIPFAHTAGDHELIYQIATEALAPPAAGVELTDLELVEVIESLGHGSSRGLRKVCRAVIAAHEAKKAGGVV